MLKRLFRDSILYTLSTILTRGISFILLPIYTRTLSPEEFGLLDYLAALWSIAAIVLTLEIMQGLARHIPEHIEDQQKKRDYASTCLSFVLGAYSIMLALVYALSTELASLLLDAPGKADLLKLAGWSYWVAGMLGVLHGQLRWELKAATSAFLSLLAALLTVAFTFVFVVWMRWGLRGALLAQVAGGLLTLLPSLYVTRTSFGLYFDGPSLRRMLAYSVPLIPSSLAVIVALYVDRIVLKELAGLSGVGIYAVGRKISLVVTLALVGFRSALTPLIYANHALASTPGELAQIFRVFCLAASAMTLVLSVFAREIVGLVSATPYQEAAAVVPLLIFSVLLSNMYIFAPGLDIGRRTGFISLINIGVAALNLALNNLLIPQLGIPGAAWSALTASCAGFAVYMYASQRIYPVPHDWIRAAKLLVIVLAGMGLVRAVALAWGDSLWIRAFLVLLILGLMVRVSGFSLPRMRDSLAGLLRK